MELRALNTLSGWQLSMMGDYRRTDGQTDRQTTAVDVVLSSIDLVCWTLLRASSCSLFHWLSVRQSKRASERGSWVYWCSDVTSCCWCCCCWRFISCTTASCRLGEHMAHRRRGRLYAHGVLLRSFAVLLTRWFIQCTRRDQTWQATHTHISNYTLHEQLQRRRHVQPHRIHLHSRHSRYWSHKSSELCIL